MDNPGKPSICNCSGCPFANRPFCPSEIPSGPVTQAWLGEAPGGREALDRRPFTGPVGQRLGALARAVGLDRGRAVVANVIACQPPKCAPDSDWRKAIACCAPYREHALAAAPDAPVFAMGKWALYALTGRASIQSWYGYPLTDPNGRRVLAAHHPVYALLYAPWWSADFVECLRRYATLVAGTFQEWQLPPLLWRASDEQLAAALDKLARDIVCVDSETAGSDPTFDKLLCLGFSDGKEAVTVIWPPGPATFEAMRRLCAEAKVLTAHNAQHDILVLERVGLPYAKAQIVDTLLLHACLYPDMPHRLSVACVKHFCAPRWKSDFHEESEAKGAAMFDIDEHDVSKMDRLCEYNGLDCYHGANLARVLLKEMAAAPSDVQHVYADMQDRLWLALDMRRFGIRFDRELAEKKMAGFARRRDRAIARFTRLAKAGHWPDIVLGKKATTQAVKDLFFKHFGLLPFELTDAGVPRLNAWSLQRWAAGFGAGKAARVAARLVLAIRRNEHMRGMVESITPSPDGRLHAPWNPWGAITDRWACGKPNLLNLPKHGVNNIRDLLCPDEGHVFVAADMDKVELRVIAILANDEPLLAAFAAGVDVHQANAVDLFGPGATKAQRDLAKRVVYGFDYGAAAATVWQALVPFFPKLRLEVVEALRRRWFKRHPAIAAYHARVLNTAVTTRQLRSGYGPRTWRFFDSHVEPAECYNRPIQAAVAKVMNDAMLGLAAEGYRISITCHDEVVLHVRRGEEEQAAAALRRHLGKPVTMAGKQWVLPTEPCVGKNWGALKAMKKKE